MLGNILAIRKARDTNHVLNNLKNFIYHNSALYLCVYNGMHSYSENIYRPTLSLKLEKLIGLD